VTAHDCSRLFLELVSNAIKFTTKGSVTLQSRRQGTGIVSVCDTGLGIPREEQSWISMSSANQGAPLHAAMAGWGWGWRSASGWWNCMAARWA